MTNRIPIKIYSNPISDWLYIEFENIDKKIYLLNMAGQNVTAIDGNSVSQNGLKIKMHHLSKGIYF